MSDQTYTRIWTMRLTFCAVICMILFFLLLPLETTPRKWVGPDLILGFACAWAIRRPDYLPVVLLATLLLLADLLLQRPPGLWAAAALMGCEHLKSRSRSMRDATFVNEWILVCLAMAGIFLAYRVGLVITFTNPPPLGLHLIELVMTMLFYPLAVAVSHWLLGVRKLAPGDMDTIGGRL